MFDFGWQEFLMVAVVLVLVVGPKDMPRILRSMTQMMRKVRSMANEFTTSLEDVARDEEMRDIKAMLQDAKEGNFDEMANIIGGDLKDTADDLKKAANVDGLQDDITAIQHGTSPSEKRTTKPASKKTTAKKAAKKATAKKVAKKSRKKSK
jgi:sec-independent protein translocase protein TatB